MKQRKRFFSVVLAVVFSLCSMFAGVPQGIMQASAEETEDGFLYAIEEDNTVTITGYNGSETKLKIPAELEGYPVTTIGYGAFGGCKSLTNIEISFGVSIIGYGAFGGCSSLTSIELPSSVVSVAPYAFNGCINLSSIEIPVSVTDIGIAAFAGCSNLTIWCESGSVAEQYAQSNGITFRLLDHTDVLYGDMNDDGAVDASDALLILKIAAKLETASEEQLIIGDVDESGTLDANDALLVLKKAAKLIDTFPIVE